MIIIDENVETYWIQLLKNADYEYFSIRENCPGISDSDVIDIARKHKGLIITEDKDFGELLFSHDLEKVSVLFMRYDQPEYHQIEKFFLKCIDNYFANQEVCFITITKNKIRIRKF
jgi:predicted nuclease of predicted toxin-antitoxin system